MKHIFLFIALSSSTLLAQSQEKRTLTPEEYEKVKSFSVKDLDNDTYVKFENIYVLDRYESRKPYFITGDDGKKKRIDIYKLLAKEGMQELGVMIFYTNEKGTLYKACMPHFTADGKVWEKYFEDIHAIDKQEANFVLKLSYVLSKEFGFQLYKAANQGKDLSKESGTYGNDICFPGDMQVSMAGGGTRALSTIHPGDRILTVDPATQQSTVVTVKELTSHTAKNYAITRLTLLAARETNTAAGTEVMLSGKTLQATPNHPVLTRSGQKKIGEIIAGDEILCLDKQTHRYQAFTVWNKAEAAGGVQPVYNIVADGGTTFMMNDVMVLQK
jgi:Hint module